MKKSELKSIIREEIKRVLKEYVDINDPKKIINLFKQDKPGIYVFAGDAADDVHKYNVARLKPLIYTSDQRINMSELINAMEKEYPNIKIFTFANIDSKGNMAVSTS